MNPGGTVEPQTLDYSRQKPPRIADRHWLMAAYVCGGLPLAVGVATAGLYLLTYQDWLEGVGVLTVLGGLVLLVAGVVAWFVWIVRTRHVGSRRWWLVTLGAPALMLANFPGCVICMNAVMFWRFTVVNNAAVPMTVTLVANDAGESRTIGPIAPGATAGLRWYLGDGGEDFNVTTAGPGTTDTRSFDYYMGMEGGPDIRITINADGTITTP